MRIKRQSTIVRDRSIDSIEEERDPRSHTNIEVISSQPFVVDTDAYAMRLFTSAITGQALPSSMHSHPLTQHTTLLALTKAGHCSFRDRDDDSLYEIRLFDKILAGDSEGAASTQPPLPRSTTVPRWVNSSIQIMARILEAEILDLEALRLTWRCRQRGVYWIAENITIGDHPSQSECRPCECWACE
ncbi:hypothetical protein BDR22DRAFT_885458 [Usnea florida]